MKKMYSKMYKAMKGMKYKKYKKGTIGVRGKAAIMTSHGVGGLGNGKQKKAAISNTAPKMPPKAASMMKTGR